jgi:hypothetical protein
MQEVIKSMLGKKRARKRGAATIASRPAKKTRKAEVALGSVSKELLFRSDGRREPILTLDANSATFTSDLTLIFEKNVARARREHKKKLVSADHVDPKG